MVRFLLFLLAPTLPAPAQTPLGQPSLDESKVQIWCAATRFVYDDAGRPHLKSTVRCMGSDLPGLVASIRPDSLRVYSLLYQPIEGRGTIYNGKQDNPARLQALVKAIIAKLKSSPARRNDPERLARVAALETALTDYVERGTPPGDVPDAMQPEAPDTAATAAVGPAELAEANGSEGAELVPDAPAPGLPLLDRLTAPLALILSILALVLYGLLRVTLGQWRRQQRRETLTASHAATAARTAAEAASAAAVDAQARLRDAQNLAPAAPAPAPLPEQLSPAQRLEVERLVSQRVDEEIRWLRANLPELLATVAPDPASPPAVAADEANEADKAQ